MKFTKEDIELIEKFVEIRNKGYYASGEQVTEIYNRVLEKRVPSTNCGSCIRQRIGELENALNHFKKTQERLSESKKDEEVDNTKEEENKTVRKAGNKKK